MQFAMPAPFRFTVTDVFIFTVQLIGVYSCDELTLNGVVQQTLVAAQTQQHASEDILTSVFKFRHMCYFL